MIGVALLFVPKQNSATCNYNTWGTTLTQVVLIEGDVEYHFTGFERTIHKQYNTSILAYSYQITFQPSLSVPTGNQFQIRVKDSTGVYIMPTMETGQATVAAGQYNAHMSDTVYNYLIKDTPTSGDYTFELWAMTGQGQLTIVPYRTNLVIMEIRRDGAACN